MVFILTGKSISMVVEIGGGVGAGGALGGVTTTGNTGAGDVGRIVGRGGIFFLDDSMLSISSLHSSFFL